MSISTKPQSRSHDGEVDLIPLVQALWTRKTTLLLTTLAGAALSLCLYAVSAEQWTASTYITKPSLYNLYKEVNGKDGVIKDQPAAAESRLYNSIQNDMFYTAMGIMASRSITLKETTPKTGKNEPVLYIASTTATSADQASAQLQAALDSANSEAVALNLPAVAPDSSVRAFNALDEFKTINNKSAKKLAALGAFLGLMLGSLFVVGRQLLRQLKQPNQI